MVAPSGSSVTELNGLTCLAEAQQLGFHWMRTMNDKLHLDPLKNAVRRLAEGLARYETDTTDTQIRDGLIQRFKFSYEICHKMLKRQLEAVSPTPEFFDIMAFADLIRSGNEQGLLLGDWPTWRNYREMRSKTSTPTTRKLRFRW